MDKFLFADGEEVCLYDDGKITRQQSKFISNYKTAAINVERAKSWKQSGEGAQFRGDVQRVSSEDDFKSAINGVYFTDNDGEAAYSFTVNGTSGIYKMRLGDEKAEEVHIINSLDYEFSGGCLDSGSDMLATELRRNFYNSDIALFDLTSGDYKTVTDGDTLDSDAFISPENGNVIYFSSRGVGRDMNGSFAGYSNSTVCKLDISRCDIEEVAVSDKYHYYKPEVFGRKLYALRIPAKEKKPNPVIEIILIPFRIIQAIANFINVFVTAFTGKSLASGGSNPAKGREYDSRKEYVKGNLINVEKEMKKNARKSKGDYGFVPLSWQVVEVASGNVIKSGVADYDILSDGTFIVTNGKHIFAVSDGKSKKLCDTGNCLKVAGRHLSVKKSDLFDL